MLVRQTPSDIAAKWDIIQYAIRGAAMATFDMEHLNKILDQLLCSIMDCWLVVENEESTDILGVIITVVISDITSGGNSLLIHSLFTSTKTNSKLWIDGFKTLSKYAVSRGCDRITGYTINEDIIRIAKKFSGSAKWQYLTIPLN